MTGDDIVVSTVVWEGIEIEVSYAAKSILNNAHLELRTKNKEPIPVTETGYRSEFLQPGAVEELGGVEAFVVGWLNEMARSREWQDYVVKSRQLSLF